MTYWTFLYDDTPDKRGKTRWVCQCRCGTIRSVLASSITSKTSKSCGCVGRAKTKEIGKLNKTHGRSTSREYRIWRGMKTRVLNTSNKDASNYLARGISICPEWINSFEQFMLDVGPCPSIHHSLDRIDNNGPYNKDNCRWATAAEQSNNKRTNIKLTYENTSLTISEWAKEKGIKYITLYSRYKRGWCVEDMFKEVVCKK